MQISNYMPITFLFFLLFLISPFISLACLIALCIKFAQEKEQTKKMALKRRLVILTLITLVLFCVIGGISLYGIID
ncbi:MAG: hypothetical protein IKI11_08050 [Neisseriaceae bacterium]|nr:hypothetical protein [Neisseriaceae bacterium]